MKTFTNTRRMMTPAAASWKAQICIVGLILSCRYTCADCKTDIDKGLDLLRFARTYKYARDAGPNPFLFHQEGANGQTESTAPTYDDLIAAYTKLPATPDARPAKELFQAAIKLFVQVLRACPGSSVARENLRDAISEFTEGQSLIGTDALIRALRSRFPGVDPGNGPSDPHELLETSSYRFEEAMDEFEILREFPDLFREKCVPGLEPEPCINMAAELVYNAQEEPVPNELYRAMGALERKVQSRVNRGKMLFNESGIGVDDEDQGSLDDNREIAADYLRKASHEAYMGLAMLGALHSDSPSYSRNLAGEVRAQLIVAETVFKSIRNGENPRGYAEDFMPSRPSAETFSRAADEVNCALSDENAARIASRTYDNSRIDLRNELTAERGEYRKPLERFSGLKINNTGTVQRGGTTLPFNINEAEGRTEFMGYLTRSISLNLRKLFEDLIIEGRISDTQVNLKEFPAIAVGEEISPIGEIGVQILELRDANLALVEQMELLQSYPQRIQVELDRVKKIAYARYRTSARVQVLQIAIGIVNSFDFSYGTSGVQFNFRPGSIVTGFLGARITDLENELQVDIEGTNSESVIKGLLIDMARMNIAIRRAETRVVQSRGVLDNMLAETNRLLEDWGQARLEAADLFFKYPSYRVERDHTIQRAEDSFARAIEACYFACKALEYEWGAERFSNPVTRYDGLPDIALPIGSNRFTRIDSLFGARDVLELANFLRALVDWHDTLSNSNVRGNPRANESDIIKISLKQKLLNFSDDTRVDGVPPEEIHVRNDALFAQWVDLHRLPNQVDETVDDLVFEFATEIDTQKFFKYSNREWNHKLQFIGIDLRGSQLPNELEKPRVELTQGGVISLRRYTGQQDVDNVERRSLQALGPQDLRDARQNPTLFLTYDVIPARVNEGDNKFETDFRRTQEGGPWSDGLAELSVAADRWSFVLLNHSGTAEKPKIPLENLTDIIFYIRYAFNQPSPALGPALRVALSKIGGACPRLD